jgi:hypothetical protein
MIVGKQLVEGVAGVNAGGIVCVSQVRVTVLA